MARAATSRRKNIPGFGWLTKKRETYHRDVAGERRKLKREALAERRERLTVSKLRAQEKVARARELAAEAKIKAAERKIATAEHKIAVAEKKLDKGGMAAAQFEAMKARMEREIEAQEQHKRAAQAKISNPAKSAAQYRLAQAVLSGTARTPTQMTRKVAQEIVDSTPEHLRSEYSRSNPNPPESSTEYRLGYSLGQMDRQNAALRRTDDELTATFKSEFPPDEWWKRCPIFISGYDDGFGFNGLAGGTTARNGGRQVNGGLSKRNPNGEGDEEYKQAQKIAELFHGRPVKEEITVTDFIREHDWLWRIGPLISLKIRTLTKRSASLPFSRDGESVVHLFCSPDGRQFYLRGGDQELNLKPLGMGPGSDWYRDHMLIGEAKEITYADKKKFHKFKLIDYYHKLGEKTKKKPMLAYDAFAHKMAIVGGQYKVETDDLVDGMSPGIVN
jgi:hypothetical protein